MPYMRKGKVRSSRSASERGPAARAGWTSCRHRPQRPRAWAVLGALAAAVTLVTASCAESFTIDPRVEARIDECGEGFAVFDYESPAGRALTGCVATSGGIISTREPAEWRGPARAQWFNGGNPGPSGAWDPQHFCGIELYLNNMRLVPGSVHPLDPGFFMVTNGYAAAAGMRLNPWERWCGPPSSPGEALEAETRRATATQGEVYIRRVGNVRGEVTEIWLRDILLTAR